MPFRWHVPPANPLRARALAASVGVHPLTAQLLLNRGVADAAQARRFLRPSLAALGDPSALPDMERAAARLKRAVIRQEPIILFGDSDVDGLTASVILYELLRDLGASVRAKPANRIAHGYGLPELFVRQLIRIGAKLLILVDCGTNQPDAIRRLAEAGIETIVVDHHVPLREWAKPYALVNPHRGAGAGAGRELCSAGLAFKVAQALLGAGSERLLAYLDLAALGTLADCSQLVGDSRILVALGVARIVDSHRGGLRHLCEATGTMSAEPEQVIKRLIPRLNASGRMGDARAVWHLLASEPDRRWDRWLEEAEAAHAAAKQLHRQIIAEAHAQVARLHFKDQFVVVVSRAGWHPGLMGPVASQLAQQYGRPAIAIAMEEEQGVGSGRSIPRFNLLEALQACEDMLLRFGGHAQACGLTVNRKHLEPFRAMVNQQVQRLLGREGLAPSRLVDLELPLAAITPDWVGETMRLSPFGYGNPRPTVAIHGIALEAVSPRLGVISDGTRRLEARGRFATLGTGERYDVVAQPVLAGGALTLTVSDVRAETAPSEPGPTSGRPRTRGSA